MTFTLDAVAEPLNEPPRVTITATESDGDLSLQSMALSRNGAPLRFEPVITGDQAIAYDYDAPFDVALLYRADGTELGSPIDFIETWASLAAWSGGVASWAVAAGVASSSDSMKAIWREATNSITSVEVTAPDNLTIELVNDDGDAAVVSVLVQPGSVKLFGTTGTEVIGSGDFTLSVSGGSATVEGSGWSATVPYSGESSKRVQLVAPDSGTGSVEDITVRADDGAGPTDVTDSDTVTLSPSGAWLVNAAVPDLAVLLELPDCESGDYYIVTSTRETTTLDENSVKLPIEGSADVVTVVLGPRRREEWTLDIGCKTEAAKKSLLAVLANSSPISLRFLASQSFLGLDGGFYDVGKVTTRREEGPAVDPLTVVSLPLTPGRAPQFMPLWQWNIDALVQTGMSIDDVMANFATITDLLLGPN